MFRVISIANQKGGVGKNDNGGQSGDRISTKWEKSSAD